MRLGWFRPVHCKSLPAQEVRSLLTTRKLLQTKRIDVEMCIRGVLRGFGLKVGKVTPKAFDARVRELVGDHPTLKLVTDVLLTARSTLEGQFKVIEKRLMTTPGVGALVSLTVVSAIDDADRFRSSRSVGAHFGLTQRKYQSGETNITGRISKCGDREVRAALYEAANVILSRSGKATALKDWGINIARRAGPKKAKVAIARKLAVIMHRMLADGTEFISARAARPITA